jgi:hypothetical protein
MAYGVMKRKEMNTGFGGDFYRMLQLQLLDVDEMLTLKGKAITLEGLDNP